MTRSLTKALICAGVFFAFITSSSWASNAKVAKFSPKTAQWQNLSVPGLSSVDKIVTAGDDAWAYAVLPNNGGVMVAFYDGSQWHGAQQVPGLTDLDDLFVDNASGQPNAWAIQYIDSRHLRSAMQPQRRRQRSTTNSTQAKAAYFNGSSWVSAGDQLQSDFYYMRAANGTAWQLNTDKSNVYFSQYHNGQVSWSNPIPYQLPTDYIVNTISAGNSGSGNSLYILSEFSFTNQKKPYPLILTRCDVSTKSCQDYKLPIPNDPTYTMTSMGVMLVNGSQIFAGASYYSSDYSRQWENYLYYSADGGENWKTIKTNGDDAASPVEWELFGATYCTPGYDNTGTPTGASNCVDMDSNNPKWLTSDTNTQSANASGFYTASNGPWITGSNDNTFVGHYNFNKSSKLIDLTPSNINLIHPIWEAPYIHVYTSGQIAACGQASKGGDYTGLFYDGKTWKQQPLNINTASFRCRLSVATSTAAPVFTTNGGSAWLY